MSRKTEWERIAKILWGSSVAIGSVWIFGEKEVSFSLCDSQNGGSRMILILDRNRYVKDKGLEVEVGRYTIRIRLAKHLLSGCFQSP